MKHPSTRIFTKRLVSLLNASYIPSDVSRKIKIIAGMQAKSVIRGGGHTPFANAANIDNAVTIDSSGMSSVSLGTGQPLGVPSFQNDTDSFSGLSSSTAAKNVQVVPDISTRPGNIFSISFLSRFTTEEALQSTLSILSAEGGATTG